MPTNEQRVQDILRRMSRLDDARELFAELNYAPAHDLLPRRDWGEAARTALAEDPQVIAAHDDFQVIYCRLAHARLPRADERQVVNRVLQNHPYALFLFSNSAQSDWHFLNVKYDQQVERRRLFRRITVGRDERLRTATERINRLDLEKVQRDLRHIPPLTIQKTHDDAFDVEPVTREFYKKYREVFEAVEPAIQGIPEQERCRLFTQRLFNRLMFLAFVQKKGWLRFGGSTDYLAALWASRGNARSAGFSPYSSEGKGDALKGALRTGRRPEGRTTNEAGNFYRDRLKPLFFVALNTPRAAKAAPMQALIGDVPYLNGGLFEEDDDDRDPAIVVPDASIGAILNDLFAPFNFTVTESTPLDVEVAVDPEMLGKVFEELVTGRHETGSYYTPKPVVSFMCREALKGYLETALPGESPEAIEPFVEDHDPERLKYPEAVLEALRRVRTCDPACGSGAYLLGMLHELLDLRTCLFAAHGVDAPTVYERKLEIIESNVYGVDIDPFAVNIARLRLWLSLAVDFDGADPPPLPNLDFKIEEGDSLTAPNPQDTGQRALRQDFIRRLRGAKADFMNAHGAAGKERLRKEIAKFKADLAAWAHAQGPVEGFDWAVEFAEVFADGGFDVVLANPPYGMEVELPWTLGLGTRDSYAAFIIRAIQMLRGRGAGCFIIPVSWETGERFAKFRTSFLGMARLESVVNLPYDVFDTPFVDTSVVSFRAKSPEVEKYSVAVLPKRAPFEETPIVAYLEPVPFSAVKQDSLRRIVLSPVAGRIFARCRPPEFRTIEDLTDSKRGIEAYQFEITATPRGQRGSMRFFQGNVYRFRVDSADFGYVACPDEHVPFSTGERIAIRRIVSRANRIMCAMLHEDFVVKKDLYILRLKQHCESEWDLRYLLGLLNSSLLSFLYLARSSIATKDDYRQLTLSGVRELPILHVERGQQQSIVDLVGTLEKLYASTSMPCNREDEFAHTEKELDEAVFSLYGVEPHDRKHIQRWLAQQG